MSQYKSSIDLYFIAGAAALGGLYQGVLSTVLNAASLQVEDSLNWTPDEADFRLGIASSLLLFGFIIGAIITGSIADIIGRRYTMILSDLIILSAFWLTYSQYFVLFCTGRLIEGISGGINNVIIPLFIREISPSNISGNLVGLYKIFLCSGIIISFVSAFGLPLQAVPDNEYWKFMFAIPALISSVRLIIFAWIYTFDTPKYHIMNGEEQEARDILNRLYKPEYIENMLEEEKKGNKSVDFLELFSKNYRTQFLISLLLYGTMTYMLMNSLNNYSTFIFLGTDNDTDESPNFILEIRILNLCIGIIRLVGALVGSYTVDFIGRRRLLIGGNIGTVIILLLFAFFGFLGLGLEQRICILLFAACIGFTYLLVCPIYASETLPLKGFSFMVFWDNTNNMIATFFFPIIADTPTRINELFLGGGCIGLITIPILYFYLKETKNMNLYEIYQMFNTEEGDIDEKEKLINKNEMKEDIDAKTAESSLINHANENENLDNNML